MEPDLWDRVEQVRLNIAEFRADTACSRSLSDDGLSDDQLTSSLRLN